MLTRKIVVETALTWLGTPWFSNQSTKQVGCDCVGFLAGVGKETGFLPPDYRLENHPKFDRGELIKAELDRLFEPVGTEKIQSADIVLIRRMGLLTHVGIVIDPLDFIHASDIERVGVRISDLSFYLDSIHEVYQIPGIK